MSSTPLEMAALTDVGRSRPHNEDAHFIDTELRLAVRDSGSAAEPDVGFRIARYAQ